MINWLKLDINILDDSKIKIIRKYPDGDALFVLWIGLLCLAMKSNRPGIIEIADSIPYEKSELANEFNLELKTVEMGLVLFQRLQMIEIYESGAIGVLNFMKHQELDKILENKKKNREKVQKFREKQKLLCNGYVTVTTPECNRTDIDRESDSDKDREKDKKIHECADALFESLPQETKTDLKECPKKKIGKEDIEQVYNAYPSRCPVSDPPRATGKSLSDKEKIKKKIKNGYSPEELIETINEYVRQCVLSRTYIKNFATFLNNIPDVKALREGPPGNFESGSDEIVRLALEKLEREGVDVSKYRSD